MKKKLNFNYPIEDLLSTTLSLQTIQKTLQNEFRIKYIDFNSFIANKSLQNLKYWEQDKQNRFIRIIGGLKTLIKQKNF